MKKPEFKLHEILNKLSTQMVPLSAAMRFPKALLIFRVAVKQANLLSFEYILRLLNLLVLNSSYVKCTKLSFNLVALNMSRGKLKLK
ncbi:hypothetical protein H5410_029648 [Solanum commersonii]|uniref:Uncharacterized protein n=1 Tax=Solanum commersonii TaxID=4109 RepID=A0A9J5YGZ4_SOLCO|nr:hypothetical protein H5410_029648 [Solanum commersonii]